MIVMIADERDDKYSHQCVGRDKIYKTVCDDFNALLKLFSSFLHSTPHSFTHPPTHPPTEPGTHLSTHHLSKVSADGVHQLTLCSLLIWRPR